MNVPHSLILEQKENTKHGEVFFPIQKYITKLNLNSPVIMTHWHGRSGTHFDNKMVPVFHQIV